MQTTMKKSLLALAFLTSAAFAGPAVANSLHDEGDFGGGYAIIGPSGGPERYDYIRKHTFRPYYEGPAYSYYYGPHTRMDRHNTTVPAQWFWNRMSGTDA